MPFLSSEIMRDVIANRPAAGSAGRIFFSTDEGKTYRDSGTSWEDCSDRGSITSVAGKTGTVTLAESDIANLTTDLAAKALAARLISTTAPLTGGGDLSADRTLGISNFTGDSGSGGAKGAVPAPSAGDGSSKFLKADGTWAVPAGGGGGSSGFSLFGLSLPASAPPSQSTLTWVNQGSATASDSYGGIFMSAPGSSSVNLRCLAKSTPATPYSFTIAALLDMYGANYGSIGIVLRDSATGKLITFTAGGYSGGFTNGGVSYYSSPTLWNSNASTVGGVPYPWTFLRVTDNGTTFTFALSSNGQDFTNVVYSASRTAWLANPNQIGIFVDSENSKPITGLFLYWNGI